MADLRIKTTYTLDMSPQEFRLISKALRVSLTEDEYPEALALQERLQTQRYSLLEQLTGEAHKVVVNIEKNKPTP